MWYSIEEPSIYLYSRGIEKGVCILKDKTKIALFLILILFLILMVTAIFYLSIEIFHPRDFSISGSANGTNIFYRLEKSKEENHYYISVIEQQNATKVIKLECAKEQYDFLLGEKECHIFYRINFFNRSKGKILKIDDKPI